VLFYREFDNGSVSWFTDNEKMDATRGLTGHQTERRVSAITPKTGQS
jgi:hypothetical protein